MMAKLLIATLCVWALLLRADTPPELADSGDSSIAAGYGPVTHSSDGNDYSGTSMFEPRNTTIAAGQISQADVDALAKVVGELKKNKCYNVWVRPRAKAKSLSDALAKCDSVYIVAHGVNDPKPNVSFGGAEKGNAAPELPPNPKAAYVWLGSCYGATNATALNGQAGATGSYHSLPKDTFGKDDTLPLNKMVQGLTEELKKLDAKEPCDPRKICILAGVQGWVKK